MTDPRSPTPELLEQIAGLLREGKTSSEIGMAIGRSRNAVVGIVHRNRALKEIGFRAPPPSMFWIVKKRRKILRGRPRSKATIKAALHPGEPLCLTIMELRAQHCRWPLWSDNVSLDEKYYCGRSIDRGSYCRMHADKGFVRGK